MRHALLPFATLIAVGCTTYLGPDGVESNVDRQGIVGGTDAPAGVYRYQVSLQTPSGFHFCGGSLVADGWVLTAAHCVQGERPSDLKVEADILRLSESGARFDVAEIRVHPDYDAAASNNDVALLRLSRSTGSIPPVVLMDGGSEAALAPTGATATITGWGTLSSGGSSPDRLQVVDVPVVSRTSCQSAYASETITQGMLCAGTAGRDSCQGDSGGPLVVDGGDAPVLTGVVSWGYGCADARHPGVYARVSHYADWIAQSVPGVRFVDGSAAPEPEPEPEPEPADDHGDGAASATPVDVVGTVTVSGVLDAGDVDVFRLVLAGPGRVTAASVSGLDTYGTLSAESGAVLAKDDDAGEGMNFSVAADAAGTVVLLEVKGYNGSVAGPYTLTLTGPAAAEPTEPAPSDADFVLDLRTGTTATAVASDRIDAGQRDLFTVEVLASGNVTLSAGTTGSTDTFGTVSDEAGAVVGSDDDAGPSLNFSWSGPVAPGLYLVEVRGYGATTTGAYDLEVHAAR